MSRKTLEEMGVSSEKLFSPEAADYWAQYGADEFIGAMRHEILNYFLVIWGYTELVAVTADPEIILFEQDDMSLTLKEFCEIILRQRPAASALSDLLAEYAYRVRPTSLSQDENS